MSTLDWANMVMAIIWFTGVVIYFREYRRMAKAYRASTETLLPLEKRITDLETLAIQNEDNF